MTEPLKASKDFLLPAGDDVIRDRAMATADWMLNPTLPDGVQIDYDKLTLKPDELLSPVPGTDYLSRHPVESVEFTPGHATIRSVAVAPERKPAQNGGFVVGVASTTELFRGENGTPMVREVSPQAVFDAVPLAEADRFQLERVAIAGEFMATQVLRVADIR